MQKREVFVVGQPNTEYPPRSPALSKEDTLQMAPDYYSHEEDYGANSTGVYNGNSNSALFNNNQGMYSNS